MTINNISNIISINHYKINLEKEELLAQACLGGWCEHDGENKCARNIATEGWHECVEEGRLLTVQEYMCMAPSLAEEFVKRWLKDNSGLCGIIMAENLRKDVAALKSNDSLGILTMFAFIVGNPADRTLRAELYNFLEDDDAGPPITEANFFYEMEKSMVAFAELKKAEWAWMGRVTAHAGPNCDQCGEAREGIGGRVCERCDLEEQERKGDWGDLGPRVFRDIPRQSHDDGFDEYDGDDEEWETESQEEERRQEMAENAERQREAEEELNRAVYEMGSEATGDPHLRIAHNVSPVVPNNWQDIVNRAPSCAGCRCDCRDYGTSGCCGHVCPSCRNRGEWVEV